MIKNYFYIKLAKKTGNDSEGFEAEENPNPPQPKDKHANSKVNNPTAKRSNTPFLDQYGRDLTALAWADKLNPVIGRKAEMKKILQILIQKEKNNILLVGDAGVGKTSVVEGLAQKLLQPGLPETVKNFRIIEIAIAHLVAGTKFRGEFEEKMACLLKEASSNPNIALFIDEFHTLMGAGSVSGALDGSNIIKPAPAGGEIKCIGIEDDALEKAVDLSLRYLTNLKLFGKAKVLIEKACAAKCFKTFSPDARISDNDLTIPPDAKIRKKRHPSPPVPVEEER